jgi:hypothetical protein
MMALFPLVSLILNSLFTLLKSQGVLKTDYSGLAQSLEAAVAPMLSMVGSGKTHAPVTDVMAAYATVIGVLNALRTQPGLPADLLAKVSEYIGAAQDATTAYVKAQAGFDLSQFAPVDPMPGGSDDTKQPSPVPA